MKLRQIFTAFFLTVTATVSAQKAVTHEQEGVLSVATSPEELLRGELSGLPLSPQHNIPHNILHQVKIH